MIVKYLIPVVAGLMLVLAVYHVAHTNKPAPAAAPPASPASSLFPSTLRAEGLVEPSSGAIAVAAPGPGVVAEVFVTPGQDVAAGARLFRLDDRSLQAELEVRKKTLKSAQAQLDRLEALPRPEELTASQRRVDEADAFLKMQQARLSQAKMQRDAKQISPFQVDEAAQAVEAAQKQLERVKAEAGLLRAWEEDRKVARAAVEVAAAHVRQVEAEIDRLTVCARQAGQVLQVNVHVGEAVGARSDVPPAILGVVQPLYVRVEIPENQIVRFMSSGMQARALPRGATENQAVPLALVRIEPLVVPQRVFRGETGERSDSRVLQVLYELKGPLPGGGHVGQPLDVCIDAPVQ